MIHPLHFSITAAAFLALGACAAGGVSNNALPSNATVEAEQRQRVTLIGFDCGDNCYLHYRPFGQFDGDFQTALCSVGPCSEWFEEQAMGAQYVARTAIISLGTGKQYDGGGNVMSDDFPAIKSMILEPASQ